MRVRHTPEFDREKPIGDGIPSSDTDTSSGDTATMNHGKTSSSTSGVGHVLRPLNEAADSWNIFTFRRQLEQLHRCNFSGTGYLTTQSCRRYGQLLRYQEFIIADAKDWRRTTLLMNFSA